MLVRLTHSLITVFLGLAKDIHDLDVVTLTFLTRRGGTWIVVILKNSFSLCKRVGQLEGFANQGAID
jgi:hypothetical protein